MSNTKERELREKVPTDVLKQLREKTKPYGGVRKMSKAAKIKYANFHIIVTKGVATPTDIAKIQKALAA